MDTFALFCKLVESCIIFYGLYYCWYEYKSYLKINDSICKAIISSQKLLYQHLVSFDIPHLRYKTPPLKKLFVKLLIDDKEKQRKENSLESVFVGEDDDKLIQVHRILIESEAGCGKTLLARKLAFDWAWDEEYLSSRFDLVMVLQGWQLKQCQNLNEALLCALAGDGEKVSPSSKLKFLQARQERCLFILDGIDEGLLYPQESCELMLTVQGEFQYPHMSIIVTRRTYPICQQTRVSKPSFNFLWTKKVTIEPLSNDGDRYTFLRRYLGKKDADRYYNALMEKLASNRVYLLDCPLHLMLAIMAVTTQQCKTKEPILTMTDLYRVSLNLFTNNQPCRTRNRQIDKREEECFIKCGKWAFANMLSTSPTSTPTDNLQTFLHTNDLLDLISHAVEESLYPSISGMLITPGTFLEFFAAFYVASLLSSLAPNRFGSTLGELFSNGLLPETCPLFYRFLAGHLGVEAHHFFHVLAQWNSDYSVVDEAITNMLYEMPSSAPLLNSLKPFIPSVWKIGSDPKFATTPWHRTLIEFGTTEGKIKTVDWNLEIWGNVPDIFTVDQLVFNVWKPDVLKGLEALKNLKVIKCNSLGCSIHDMSEEIWNAFLQLTQKLGTRKIVVDINGHDDIATIRDIVKKLHREAKLGRWQALTIHQLQLLDLDAETDRLSSSLITNLARNEMISEELGKAILECNNNNDEPDSTRETCKQLTPEEKSLLDMAVSGSANTKDLLFMKYIQATLPEFYWSSSDGASERKLWKYLHLDASIILTSRTGTPKTVALEMMGTGEWKPDSHVELLDPFGNIERVECNNRVLHHVIREFPSDWQAYETMTGLKLTIVTTDTLVFKSLCNFKNLQVFIMDLTFLRVHLHDSAVGELLESLKQLQLKTFHIRDIAHCHLDDVTRIAEGIYNLQVSQLDALTDHNHNKTPKSPRWRKRLSFHQPFYLQEFKLKFGSNETDTDRLLTLLDVFQLLLSKKFIRKLSVLSPTNTQSELLDDIFTYCRDFIVERLTDEEMYFPQNYQPLNCCKQNIEEKLSIMYFGI